MPVSGPGFLREAPAGPAQSAVEVVSVENLLVTANASAQKEIMPAIDAPRHLIQNSKAPELVARNDRLMNTHYLAYSKMVVRAPGRVRARFGVRLFYDNLDKITS